jgi:hypothetical protein
MKSSFRLWKIVLISLLISFFTLTLQAEEGMLPLSELHKLDLKEMGFEIDPQVLYNPDGISLIDGIINLSGCTASFVSSDGLLLTNYHCAFRAIQSVTSKEADYMRDGFAAANRALELPAEGYTVRIIQSYKDVSREVLKPVKKKMTAAQRTKAIEKQMKKIVARTEKQNPGSRAEVAEMFIGKTYVLFVYTYLKDIRLVYAPPRSIGEYGGEVDNWMWPRHTGDFTFMRAYTAPDGSSAAYSKDNIPYQPRKFLQVAPEGVKEEDFVFILGYPGRTFRHRTSHFVSYEENVRMPAVEALYQYNINVLERLSEEDGREVEIKLAPKLKGLWNTMKRYRGQLKGLKNLKLAQKRRGVEKELQKYIDADPGRKKKYGDLLGQIETLYKEIRQDAQYDHVLKYLIGSSVLLTNAYTLYEHSIERNKKDVERQSPYMNRNIERTKIRLGTRLNNYYEKADRILFKKLLMMATRLEGRYKIPAVTEILETFSKNNVSTEKAIDNFLDDFYTKSELDGIDYNMRLFNLDTKEFEKENEPFLWLAARLYPTYRQLDEKLKRRKGIQDNLMARLITIKREFAGKDFIPDANRTLRLTYGRVRGYSPADAVYYKPFTSLTGIVQKNVGKEPFKAPEKLLELHRRNSMGHFMHPALKDVPINMLYSTDTTGGNSGSPILNSKGQLIGLNFDRVYEATINDYAWDEAYSRSIGVDIRYILWLLEQFGDAEHLLKEMNVNGETGKPASN